MVPLRRLSLGEQRSRNVGVTRAIASVLGAALGFLAVFGAEGCTTFDGLVASDGVDASDANAIAPDAKQDVADGPSRGPGYLSVPEAAKLCSRINACPSLSLSVIASTGIQLDPLNYSACLDWAAGPVPPNRPGFAIQSGILQCIAQAGDCGSAGACLSIEYLSDEDKRCKGFDAGAGTTERCDDDGLSVLRCGSTPLALHCRSPFYGPNASCKPGLAGTFWCALEPPCPPTTCNGALLQYCGSSGLHSAIVCSVGGYTCGTDPDTGSSDCLSGDRVKPCSNVGTSCRDGIAVVCDGFNESAFDCKALGGTCSKLEGPAVCVLPESNCSPFDVDANTCKGDVLSACVGGRKATVDCASIGKRCAAAVGSRSGRCE